MVDAMDFHIGRLVDYLKSTGQFENTVFIFTSDNGSEASGSDNFNNKVMRFGLGLQDYNNDYETLGAKGSYSTIGPSFASAAASPLSYYKFYAGEGGLRVPLVISGNSIAASRQKTNAFSYVTDITPTILEIAGVARPGQHYGGRLVEPIIGKSLLPLLKGEVNTVYSEDDVIGYELGGHAALFQGDYKIVNIRGPVGDDIWHLYNIVSDPGETIDLREKMPGRFLTMLENYQVYVSENGVLPVPEGYQQVRQVLINGMRDRFGGNILILLFTVIIMIPLYFTYRFAQRKNV
jgi:arylsulfatase A-like enzyme